MFYGSRKHDLRFCLSEMLKFSNEVIQFRCCSEKNLYQHRIFSRHAITFYDVRTRTDIGIKFFLLNRLYFQINKGLDIKPKSLSIDMCIISFDITAFSILAEIAVGERNVCSAICLIEIRAFFCNKERICKSVSSIEKKSVFSLRITTINLFKKFFRAYQLNAISIIIMTTNPNITPTVAIFE